MQLRHLNLLVRRQWSHSGQSYNLCYTVNSFNVYYFSRSDREHRIGVYIVLASQTLRHLWVYKSKKYLLYYTITVMMVSTVYLGTQFCMTLSLPLIDLEAEKLTYVPFIIGTWLADALMVKFSLITRISVHEQIITRYTDATSSGNIIQRSC